jgi:hypothetical protein
MLDPLRAGDKRDLLIWKMSFSTAAALPLRRAGGLRLDQATQQNSALVEESAAAADRLKQQAARLAELVGVFKLRQQSGQTTVA